MNPNRLPQNAKGPWPLVPLDGVLRHRKEFIRIDEMTSYKRCRVQLHAKGIVLRDTLDGAAIKTKTQQVCRAGEFLVAEIDAKLGGYGIVPEALDGAIVSSHYFLFEIDTDKLDRDFLGYYIRTPQFFEQVSAQGSTNYAAIRPSHVLAYQIPLPPLAEQRRLVAKLDQFAGKIAEICELRNSTLLAVAAFLESSLRTVFNEAIEKFPARRFGEVCQVVRGGSPRPAGSPLYYGGPIPFLKVADLTKDDAKYVTSHSATITEAGLPRSRCVGAGTLMLTNSGATLGVPKICSFKTCFNDGIQAFLGLPGSISKEFLYWFFRSKTGWFRDWCARGQGQPNLNTEMVKQLAFPAPEPVEQRRIVAYFDALQAKVDRLKHLQAQTAAELDALLPAILDRAFKGGL